MRAGPGFQFGGYVSWRELSPALMVRSVPFTLRLVGDLGWLWIQWLVYRWKRNRQIIHKGCMYWTPDCCSALSQRRRHWVGKGECLSSSYDVWGQNRRGPGCCPYLEHISSTDCAFSFLSDSLPVFCLLFRHR